MIDFIRRPCGWIATACFLSLGFTNLAAAEGPSGPSGPKSTADSSKASPLKISVKASTGVHATDNRDLRALDESSDRAIIDSDDRRNFGHSDISASVTYQVKPDTDLRVQTRFNTIWKDDMLGRSAGSSGDLRFYQLNVGYTAYSSSSFELSLRMGRQPFSIGGVSRDYMLAGTLDAITATADFKRAGRLRILGLDFFGGNSLPETGYRYYRDGRQTTYNLRGETNTLRSGLVYELDSKAQPRLPLELRAYYFYATIGGGPIEESGSDITYGGALGNYRDRDYQHMTGLRTAYLGNFGRTALRVFGEFAMSMGIDRKAVTDRNVNTEGMAYGGGLESTIKLSKGTSIGLGADFYHFDGSQYASDGLEFERGFVGFMGARIGGGSVGRYLAWRPASHVDASGVTYAPHDQARVSGTEFLHANFNVESGKLSLTVDYWNFLKDTSSTFLKLAQLDNLAEPPFGHTRAEFAAQERFGKSLGQAVDVRLGVAANDNLSFVLAGGVFLPGEYYEIEVDKVAGNQMTALGSETPEMFWAASAGMEVSF